MFYHQGENKYIQEGQQFILNGITYPASWLNNANSQDKLNLGLVEVVKINEPENHDFYFVQEVLSEATLSYTNIPRDPQGIRVNIWEKIKTYRDFIQEAGVQVGTEWFHNDIKSRSQWERMVNRSYGTAVDTPYTIGGVQVNWKTMNNTLIPLTTAKILEVVAAMELQEAIIFNIAETKRVELEALTTVELSLYDITAGFPAQYQPI